MDEQFKQLVSNSKSILILLPTKPFFDQVAAALGLFLALREEKDVSVISSTPITVDFNRLIGINKVTQEFGNKNLIIKFLDYNPKDIERVKYDLEEGQTVYLSIIPMPGKKAPAKDQVQMSYSGVSADTIFLVGGLTDSHFPQLSGKDLASAKLAHIGIKDIQLTGDKHPVSLARPASSVSELVYYLLKNTGCEIDQDAASDLLMGIEDSTHNFSDTSANADTFMAIADLMKRGARRYQAQATIGPAQFPPGSIPGMPPGMQMPRQPNTFPQGQAQMPPMGQVPPGGFTPLIQQGMSQQQQRPQGQQMPVSPYPTVQPQGSLMPQIPPGGFTPQMQGPLTPQMQGPLSPMSQQQRPLAGSNQQPSAQQNTRQIQNSQPLPNQNDEPEDQDQQFDDPPEDWLSKPKVYKGTSLS
jgi:hypothetical protein